MNWSFAAIFLALLFTTACSQRGGRRYLPDQPLEESLAVDNHRFQTRSRGDVEDARRGESRRARIQETTETNSRTIKGRTRINSEEPRQFRSRSGKEQESKPSENRQFASRRSLETDPTRQSSHEGTRNERFRSRESPATTADASKVKNSRTRTRIEATTVEYRSRGTENKRFPSRENSRSSKDFENYNVAERPDSRHRSQTTRKNAIEPPKYTEPVTEGFISRQPLRDEIQRGGVKETTEKNVQNHNSIPITEGKVPDLTSASNEIEISKRTRPLDSTVTEKLHSRQIGREGSRRSRVDQSTENTNHSQRGGRRKTEENQTRGAGLESRRRSRTKEIPVTERFHSRQLGRDDYPPKRGRVNSSTEKIRSENGNTHTARGRKGHEFTSRGSASEYDKRRPAEISSTERFHSRESERDKLQSRIEPSTTATIDTEISPEISSKEINTVDAENKIQTETIGSVPTAEANIDAIKPITSQPDPLSTENTVDFPIKSNDVEEPNRTSRKLESDIPERINQNHHRGQNHDFENSKRGRLESTLSRDRSRPSEPPSRGTEGRRASRRFSTQGPDASKETYNDKGRRTQQRLSSRTRNIDIPKEHGRQKLNGEGRKIPSRHRSESPVPSSRNIERITQSPLAAEPVTESKIENKVLIETQIQNEQKNEVTAAEPAETQVASTQRALSRNVSQKPGNRGRGSVKGTNVQEEKEHSGEVKDEDNYPEVYKQLKKSGTDPKDILNPSQRPVFGSDETKTPVLRGTTAPNSNFRSRDHKSGELNQRIKSKIVTDEETRNTVSSTEKIERFSNFRSSRFKTPKTYIQKSDFPTTVKTTHEITTEEKLLQDEAPKEKKYNPYNYQEIRSFNRKKNSNLPERNKNYRNTAKSFKNSDEQKQEEKNVKDEFHLTEDLDPTEEKSKKNFAGPGSTRFRSELKNNEYPSLKREGIRSQTNVDEIINAETPRKEITRSFTGPGNSRFRSPLRSNVRETKNNEDEEDLVQTDEFNDTNEDGKLEKDRTLSKEEEKELTPQNPVTKETSDRGRKFGLTAPDNDKFRKTFNTRPRGKSESESIKSLRRTSFTSPGISKFKSRKENDIETSSPEANTEKTKTKSNYIPRNRESDIRKFKARTEKTLEDVTIEPIINRNNNLFNRNEHSFRRRSFTSPASEGTEVLTTIQYKNSMVAARTRPPFVPQRKKFVKPSTLDPLPISRFKARKSSLSKLFNEEVLKEEDDLRPNIDDLSIDSLVSESEHSSFTTVANTISSARKRPRYTESHIQRVPPKRRGSEYFKFTSSSSTTSKPEVYTVLAVPYYDEGTSAPETTISSEFVLDSTTHSSTLSDIIPTTIPISTTDLTSTSFSTTETSSTSFSTTETPSTTTFTTTEASQSSTSGLFTSEMTTIKTTTTEPTTIKSTTDFILSKTTTEPLTTSTTELITTIPTTSTQLPTTITTTTTTTTTTKRPTTTTTTKRPTSTTTTTKRPTTTTKRPTKSTTISTTKPTTRKTTVVSTTKPTTKKPTVTSTKVPSTKKATPKPTVRSTTAKPTEKPLSTTVTTHSTPVLSTQNDSHLTTTFKIDDLLSTKHPNFLSTIAYLARNLTVTPTSYENANTANFKTPSRPTENTTPMQNQSAKKNDYFVYGLLPNNNVVRKVVKTTASPMDVPFYIYGLYPNGTIVRRFPNGTIVPDETEEENEVIGKVEPGSEESLETVVKKDNPLSYLYPPGNEKTTTHTVQLSSTTTKEAESSSKVIPIDPRIAPASSIEKPGPTTVKSTTKLTTPKPPTKSTTTKSTTKLTTTKPSTKLTTKSTTKMTTTKPPTKSTTKATTKLATTKPPTKSITKSPTKTTTARPTTKSTVKSTTKLTTVKPAMKQAIKQTSATTQKTSVKATSKTPVTKAANKQTTAKPTTKMTTTKPVTTTKPTPRPSSAKPISKTTTSKPTSRTTSKPTIRATTTKPTPKANVVKTTPKPSTNKPTTKSPTTTIKPSSVATTKSTMVTTAKTKLTSKTPPKSPTTKPNKSQEKSTIKTITTPLSDAELLNNLLSQDVKEIIPKGTTESTVALADKVIQLAIERAQKSSTAPPALGPEDLQSLSTTSTPVKKQPLGGKPSGKSNKLSDETNTNKTGKISVWVIPPDESTTSQPSVAVSKSEAELLTALLSSPNSIDNLSLSDQLLLADIISSTAAPQTTRKKKKKSRTTTTTTTPPPPAFPILQYLFGRNRGGGGGLFQRGLFRGGGLRNLETATPSPQNDGGIFQNDGLPQGQGEVAAESQEDPQQGEGGPGLVSAAINVSRAVSQFMGFVIQGAAQSFQNYLNTRTRALANALTYPPAS